MLHTHLFMNKGFCEVIVDYYSQRGCFDAEERLCSQNEYVRTSDL